jgi:hypothetical protein
MYSELDDHGDSWKTYPPPNSKDKPFNRSYNKYGNVDWEYVLRDAGVLSEDATQDPDFVAGRYKSVAEYQKWMDPDADPIYFDAMSQTYVAAGEQTPGSVWDPEQQRYLAPPGYVWDRAQEAWIDPGYLPDVPWIVQEDGSFVKNPDFRGDDYGPKPGSETVSMPDRTTLPGEDDTVEIGGSDLDYTAGSWGDAGAAAQFDIPEGMEIGPDGKLQFTQDTLDAQAQAGSDQQAREQQESEDAAAARAAADEAQADTQVLPDETHGATHVHDTPADDHFASAGPAWTQEQHEHVTYAAQPHISIPLGQISADIAQGNT